MKKYDCPECNRLINACVNAEHEVQQVLGKALGYPYMYEGMIGKSKAIVGPEYAGAVKLDQVCVGDNVAASLADEAAERIAKLEHENKVLLAQVIELKEAASDRHKDSAGQV